MNAILAGLLAIKGIFPCPPSLALPVSASQREVRWLLLAEETHGTNEIPDAIYGMVCAASIKRPVNVALEYPVGSQHLLDDFFRSDTGGVGERKLLASLNWQKRFADGKTSRAMVTLLRRLRELKKRGVIVKVSAFDADSATGPSDRERKMATFLMGQKNPNRRLTVVITGGFHAGRVPRTFRGNSVPPMASFMPKNRTLSVLFDGFGGTKWNCEDDGCGVHVSSEYGRAGREIVKDLSGRYDVLYHIGVPTTASTPANG